MAWLRKYKPEELVIDEGTQARMDAGNEVGDLAMGLFGDYVEVTAYNNDRIDLTQMIWNTQEEMAKGTPIICEASFDYNGLYCAVDILKKEGDGWAIYEVKSSTHDDKDVYFADVAYQKYVLEHCGINVTGTYLVVLNNEYIFDGTLKLDELFRITDVSEEVANETGRIEYNLAIAEKILNDPEEPDIDLSPSCNDPYKCAFWNYCAKDVPSPSVFDLYRLQFKKKIEYYRKGMVTYEDLICEPKITNEKQLRQMDYYLNDKGTYVDKEAIREFLDTLSYPLYFLDFETMMPVIPVYIGTKPYQQITFQYSLHYIESEGGKLKHKEFLAESGPDPRRALAEQLCKDIPMNVCVTAYNKQFECTRIRELAEAFPDLAEHLLNIRDNIIDLLVPFQSGYYYNREMGGSFSIKSVLPAIFPDDPALDYHNLEDIHNGSEAMNIFPKIQFMEPEEREKTRRNLLKYCELDTFAMVKVWKELTNAAK
ncbi:MAG: DUF2779 domain-containing protein [Lachnospiraceae bacterium]|nr:DUF2779 domain-containing protein [Lachnospiraceae bacterium]